MRREAKYSSMMLSAHICDIQVPGMWIVPIKHKQGRIFFSRFHVQRNYCVKRPV
jgi:hypothetical protein